MPGWVILHEVSAGLGAAKASSPMCLHLGCSCGASRGARHPCLNASPAGRPDLPLVHKVPRMSISGGRVWVFSRFPASDHILLSHGSSAQSRCAIQPPPGDGSGLGHECGEACFTGDPRWPSAPLITSVPFLLIAGCLNCAPACSGLLHRLPAQRSFPG